MSCTEKRFSKTRISLLFLTKQNKIRLLEKIPALQIQFVLSSLACHHFYFQQIQNCNFHALFQQHTKKNYWKSFTFKTGRILIQIIELLIILTGNHQ